jgi:hypothetical protein
MPEAAGRGEGETEYDGKLTWAVDREPSPASVSGFRPAPGLGVIGLIAGRKKRTQPQPIRST